MPEMMCWEVGELRVELKEVKGKKYQIHISGTVAKQELENLEIAKRGVVDKIYELESKKGCFSTRNKLDCTYQ